MDYSSWLVKQDGGETYQITKMGILESESKTYLDDGSTSTGTIITIPDYLRSQAVISNDDKGRCCFTVPGTIFTVPDYRGLEISNADKGEPDSHGSQAVISKELTSKDRKGGPYLHFERNTFRDDGPTTKESISPCNDLIVSPTVKPMSGKAETCQTTDVRSLDAESNTHQDDGSTGGSQEGEVQRASMESLPADIVQDILSWAPAESVLECKLVCKKWVTLIRQSNFANIHLSRLLDRRHGNDNLAAEVFFACRTDDPDEFRTLLFHGGQVSDIVQVGKKYIYNQNLKRIHHPPMHQDPMREHLVGSCNGLVCAFQQHHLVIDPIYICNPLTREYVHLPQLVIKKEDVEPNRVFKGEVVMYGHTACGFGYVRSTNEYKVVRVHYLSFTEGNVEVYTLGSGCGWRAIGKVFYRLNTSCSGKGTYANDAIYWTSRNKILAFDLAKEEFRLLSVPPRLEKRGKGDRCGLVALGRRLCLYVDDRSRVAIWSLMGSSDSKETWHMEFEIDYEAAVVDSRKNEFKPILLTKDSELIFVYAESALYSYDTKTKFLKMISNEASADHFEAVEAIVHVNTFTSLQAIGENSKRFTVPPRCLCTSWDDVIDELDRAVPGEKIDTTRFRLR